MEGSGSQPLAQLAPLGRLAGVAASQGNPGGWPRELPAPPCAMPPPPGIWATRPREAGALVQTQLI